MTNYLVFSGKSVEKALEQAGKELNQEVEDLQYDVVSYGSSGIFGLVGVKKAKIRVRVEQEPQADSYQQDAKQEARDLVKDAFNIEEEEPPAIKEKKESAAPVPSEPPSDDVLKAVEFGRQALEKIINEITEDTTIEIEAQSDRILYKVDGGNSALLIGKRGQTLEAIQYLVEKIVNKQSDTRIRVLVDVKGYLGTRKASLKKLALRMAEKARKNNKPVTVGQMNAYDRRIVHMTLKENPEVRTQSMGEGYYRKLVIFPKKRSRKKSQGPRNNTNQ